MDMKNGGTVILMEIKFIIKILLDAKNGMIQMEMKSLKMNMIEFMYEKTIRLHKRI